MTDERQPPNMSSISKDPDPNKNDLDTSHLQWLSASELRVVLVCDVVESVRWMEHDEDYAISRWQAFAQHVRSVVAPANGGTVVKSTGDGLMLEFASAPSAVKAATAMHSFASAGNMGILPEGQMHLRIGLTRPRFGAMRMTFMVMASIWPHGLPLWLDLGKSLLPQRSETNW